MADDRQIAVRDLLKIKHRLAQSATVKGLNPLDIRALKETDWTGVADDYRKWYRATAIHAFSVILGLAGVLLFLGVEQSWLAIAGTIAIALSVAAISKRHWHKEGYFDGFDAGYERGVHRALGLTGEQAKDLADAALEIELGQRALDAIDRKAD